VAIQDTLLTAWGVHPEFPGGWRSAFFYRTITLDGRWLLTDYEVPIFDVQVFAALVRSECGSPLVQLARDLLMRDPVMRVMSELFEDSPLAPVRLPFQVIEGGR
jgi:hypothetical protein